ncbi:MAG: glycosyltransferase [Proteobacteria bacterium]|nr:glycosyltransferase [Pseudomonadota bacterium]
MSEGGEACDGCVSVLMPVHNGERYLREAIESILSQTFRNYRLIIVDDASSDSSWSIIEAFDDKRVVKVRLQESKGIVNALNIALEMTDTEYIARMDADDVARNDRFKKQVDFLRLHPEVGVCGSSIKMIRGRFSCYVRYPENHDEILCSLAVYKRAVCHPSVMMRRSVLNHKKLQYTDEYPHAEDLSLWHELVRETRFYNLQEPLLAYRVHPEQISTCYNEEQISQTRALLNRSLPKYFPSISPHTRKDLLRLVTPEFGNKGREGGEIDLPGLYARMEAVNRADRLSVPAIFNSMLLSKFFDLSLKRYLGLRNTAFVLLLVFRTKPVLLLDAASRLRLHVSFYLSETWAR